MHVLYCMMEYYCIVGIFGGGRIILAKLLSFCGWRILIGRQVSLNTCIVNENSRFNFGKC